MTTCLPSLCCANSIRALGPATPSCYTLCAHAISWKFSWLPFGYARLTTWLTPLRVPVSVRFIPCLRGFALWSGRSCGPRFMLLAQASAWLLVLFLPGTLPVFPPSCLALGPLPSRLCGMRCFALWRLCWCRPAVFMFGCWSLRGSPGRVLRSSYRRPLGRAVFALRRTMARRSPAGFPARGTGFCWSSGAD